MIIDLAELRNQEAERILADAKVLLEAVENDLRVVHERADICAWGMFEAAKLLPHGSLRRDIEAFAHQFIALACPEDADIRATSHPAFVSPIKWDDPVSTLETE